MQQKMNTRITPRQDAPELALRLRQSAKVLTRTACILYGDGRLKSGLAARDLPLSEVLGAVRNELFPDPRGHRNDDEGPVCSLAITLIWKNAVGRKPNRHDVIAAAKRLRIWAISEESIWKYQRRERRAA